jgi:hypothetical protein
VVLPGGTGGGGGGGGPGPNPNRRNDNLVFANPGDVIGNPAARGLPRPETRIDYQDLSGMLEVAVNDRLSGFVEVPVRFLDPALNNNTAGLADMNAGFKWAFIRDDETVATFQFRTYIPTGASTHGLGTNHVSLEPALLFNQRWTERLTFLGELRDWIPVGGTDFEGNVIRYGIGFNYLAYKESGLTISPVVELVGWTVLGGKETAAITPQLFEIQSATGDTIVNGKVGVRMGLGSCSDFAVSYGRALTGAVWYKNLFRIEYRLFF